MADYVSRFKGSEIDDGIEKSLSVGDVSNLTTTEKTNVVGAVNEVHANVGNLENLSTTEKTNLVVAINEIDGNVGNKEELSTTNKDSLVEAINEVDEKGGDLSTLSTENKSNLVGAINEVVTHLGNLSELDTTNKDTVVAALNELFSRIMSKGKIYSTTQLTAVTGIIPQTLLNSDADFTTPLVKTLPANFLTKNKILKICIKGVFSCTSGATATLAVKLGNITLKSIVESFPNNKTDYYYEKEIFLGARTIGVNGTVIMQGRSLVQDGAAGQTALIPLALTAPVAVDTTQTYLLEVLFNWTTENAANNLRVSEATIEVL